MSLLDLRRVPPVVVALAEPGCPPPAAAAAAAAAGFDVRVATPEGLERSAAAGEVDLCLASACHPADVRRLADLVRRLGAMRDVDLPVVAVGPERGGLLAACLAAGADEHLRDDDGTEVVGARLRAALGRRTHRLSLRAKVEHLGWLSATDDLTDLPNRRALRQELTRLRSLAVRQATPFSLAMFDLDRFKLVNDSYGHNAGDLILREVAALLTAAMRDSDMVGRWGGEEFLALLPGAGLDGALATGERVRSALAAAPLVVGHHRVPVTISAGCASLPGDDDELLQRADLALYAAKREGRDRVRSEP